MGTFDDAAPDLFTVAYRVSFRMTGSRSDSEDIAQETLARAMLRWAKISSYSDAWVAATAANLAIDKLRHAKRRKAPSFGVHSGPGADERLDLQRALAALPRRQREVLVLRFLADLPERVVAERMGCSVGAVKTHGSRALSALRASCHLAAPEGG